MTEQQAGKLMDMVDALGRVGLQLGRPRAIRDFTDRSKFAAVEVNPYIEFHARLEALKRYYAEILAGGK